MKAGIQPYKRPSSTLIKVETLTMSATVKHQVGLIAQNFENDVTEKCGYTIYFLGHKRRERERETREIIRERRTVKQLAIVLPKYFTKVAKR